MSELTESMKKIAGKFSADILDNVNLTIDEQKTQAEVSNCVDRDSFNLGLSCAMQIVNMYKKGIEERYLTQEGDGGE